MKMVCMAGSGMRFGAISRSRSTSAATAGDSTTPSASSQPAHPNRPRVRTGWSAAPD